MPHRSKFPYVLYERFFDRLSVHSLVSPGFFSEIPCVPIEFCSSPPHATFLLVFLALLFAYRLYFRLWCSLSSDASESPFLPFRYLFRKCRHDSIYYNFWSKRALRERKVELPSGYGIIVPHSGVVDCGWSFQGARVRSRLPPGPPVPGKVCQFKISLLIKASFSRICDEVLLDWMILWKTQATLRRRK